MYSKISDILEKGAEEKKFQYADGSTGKEPAETSDS